MRESASFRHPDPSRGVFETILVLDGHPVELDAHLQRLEASLEALFPDCAAPSLAALETPAGTRTLRIAVAPADDGKLEATAEHRAAAGHFATENGGKVSSGAVSLSGLTVPGGLGAHKWADRAQLEAEQAELPSRTLPLIVDSDGAALEASRANVFAVRRGALFTPPLDGRILPGITRARVLDLAAELDLATRETELHRDDLLAAEEVFLTGSVRGIEAVGAIDESSLPAEGEVTTELAGALRRAWSDTGAGSRLAVG